MHFLKSSSDTPADTPAEAPLRMRDLVRGSGLSRETIHFYQREGLLPEPLAKVRNSAIYGPEHLERLARIRVLRDEQFLPLRAIKAIFLGISERDFTPSQSRLLRAMREASRPTGRNPSGDFPTSERPSESVDPVERHALVQAGLIEPPGPEGELAEEDAEILIAWAELKRVGIGPERGIEVTDIAHVDRAMSELVAAEFDLFLAGFSDLSGAEAVEVVHRAIPILERLIAAVHRKKINRFIGPAS
ncbi:MAG: MerR family transcriptional regulator [Myxococcota bacterium]|nr:MerR family transcriptional regulator [Myxococcota bacterium]